MDPRGRLFIRGGSAPRPNPPTLNLSYTIFHEKVSLSPFVYLLLTNDIPSIYHVWKFASLLTALNAQSFK